MADTSQLAGQWWERQSVVLFLPIGQNPNDFDPAYQGWVKVGPEQAGQHLQRSQARELPDDWDRFAAKLNATVVQPGSGKPPGPG